MIKKWMIRLLRSRSFLDLVFKKNEDQTDYIYYVQVNPQKISHISLVGETPHLSGSKAFYGAFSGCFDLLKRHFANDFMYQTVGQLLNGEDWESTIYFKKLIEKKDSRAKSLKHVERLDDLINSLSEEGYKSQYELGRGHLKRRIGKWVVPRHEIIVGMDRKGKLFRIKNGRHRLAVAQHIGIKQMPAILTCYHRDAKHLLPRNRKVITKKVDDRSSVKKSSNLHQLDNTISVEN